MVNLPTAVPLPALHLPPIHSLESGTRQPKAQHEQTLHTGNAQQGTAWPIRRPRHTSLHRSHTKHSITANRPFDSSKSLEKHGSVVDSNEALLSPITNRIVLSPVPISPELRHSRIKRTKTPPEIQVRELPGNSSQSENVNSPGMESVTAAGRDDYNMKHVDEFLLPGSNFDFLSTTVSEFTLGFQDVDLALDPSTISLSFDYADYNDIDM